MIIPPEVTEAGANPAVCPIIEDKCRVIGITYLGKGKRGG
jgi:hypothetical protein